MLVQSDDQDAHAPVELVLNSQMLPDMARPLAKSQSLSMRR
jgi:hypothetical protein